MKVLVTASTLPRWEGDAVPAFVLDQAVALARAVPGLELHLLAPHHAGAARAESMRGIPVQRFRYCWPEVAQRLAYPAILPNLRRQPWLYLQVPLLLVAEFLAVYRFCRRHRPDALYSHWFMPQAVAGALAARLAGVPHVFTSHSSDVAVMRRVPWLGPWLVRAIVRRMRAGTCVSRRTLGRLRAFFTAPGAWEAVAPRIAVLPMGVSVGELAPLPAAERAALRTRLGLEGSQVVLFLGRLTAKKGLTVLLDAVASLAPTRPGLLLIVAGEGELREAVGRGARERGIADRLRMPGFVAGAAKADLLRAADVLAVPSVETADEDVEGLPVALLEGLAAALPCVATDASGADDVLTDGADGFLVPQRDAGALATALACALDLGGDERARLTAAARERAAAFDWPVVAAAHWRHLFAPR